MLPPPPSSTLFPYTTLFRSDHLIQLEFARHVEVDQPGHVEREAIRPHGGTLDTSLAEEGEPVKLDLGADRNHADDVGGAARSEEHTSELQSHVNLVCRLLLE